MKKNFKQSSQAGHEHQTHAQQTQAREFASVEEVLREDRAGVEVPAAVEQRLGKSIEDLPKPEKPWWKRFMG